MKNNEYTIHMMAGHAICPTCQGAARVTVADSKVRCQDCGAVYQIVEFGRNDREMVCVKE